MPAHVHSLDFARSKRSVAVTASDVSGTCGSDGLLAQLSRPDKGGRVIPIEELLDLSVPWIASVVGDAAARDAWELHRRAFWADYDPSCQWGEAGPSGPESGESVTLKFTRADLRRRLAPIRYLRLLVCCPAGLTDAARFVMASPRQLGPSSIVGLQAQGAGDGVWVVVVAPDAGGMRRFREAFLESYQERSISVIADEENQSAHAIVCIEQASALRCFAPAARAVLVSPPGPCLVPQRALLGLGNKSHTPRYLCAPPFLSLTHARAHARTHARARARALFLSRLCLAGRLPLLPHYT